MKEKVIKKIEEKLLQIYIALAVMGPVMCVLGKEVSNNKVLLAGQILLIVVMIPLIICGTFYTVNFVITELWNLLLKAKKILTEAN